MTDQNRKRRVRIPLHLKLSAGLFLAVSAVMVALSLSNFRDAQAEYKRDAHRTLSQLQATFETLLERSNRELFRYADQYSLHAAEGLNSPELPPPSLLSSIESIYYLNRRGEVVGVSKLEGSEFSPDPKRIHWAVNSIKLNQLPVATLDCSETCFQSVFIPLITDDGQELVVNINRSAALLLQDFYTITSTDILLMIPGTNGEKDKLKLRGNTVNRKSLSGINADRNQILGKIHAEINDSDFLNDNNAVHEYIGEIGLGYFGLRFFHVNDGSVSLPLVAVVLEDAAYLQHRSEQALTDSINASALTILLSLLLIFLILRPPLKRLNTLTEVLRLLPEKRFPEAGKKLHAISRNALLLDEIDLLRDTMENVNYALEDLNESVEQHRNALREKIQDLSQANEFTNALLDNSPLVTIIHDLGGKIRNVNAAARKLTGLGPRNLELANVNDFIRHSPGAAPLASTMISGLRAGRGPIQNELPFVTNDNRHLDYLWIHSLITVNNEELLLSSGMDITERREAAESLNWLGQHDRVTGLLNRSTFIERAGDYIHRHKGQEKIQLLMLDIDDFAAFNDRFGFETGDKLLNSLAEHISATLPSGSLVARTGAGEYCALLHGADLDDDSEFEILTRYQILTDMGREEVGLSAVIDDYHEEIGEIDEWLSNTTAIMARIKQKARGRLYHAKASDEDSHTRREKYRIKEQLIEALEKHRLTLFFQPILNLAENRVSHCECLVRLLDTDGQFLPPAAFLNIAAEFNLLPRIDYAVLEMAMRQQNLWQQRGIDTGLSINITAPTMEQADFQDKITVLLQETGANPQRLIFEVVETDALENINTAKKLLGNFKSVGAKIAFDDFGVGFTSFEYVRELPVDYIKIDQSFIRYLHDREDDQQLVKSMIEMSHRLGKKVIVEGVETREAVEILREMGAEYLQGYYISRPLPIDAVNLGLKIIDAAHPVPGA